MIKRCRLHRKAAQRYRPFAATEKMKQAVALLPASLFFRSGIGYDGGIGS